MAISVNSIGKADVEALEDSLCNELISEGLEKTDSETLTRTRSRRVSPLYEVRVGERRIASE
jgi:hypothetical protein